MSGTPFARGLPRLSSLPGFATRSAGRGFFSPHLRCVALRSTSSTATPPSQRPRHFHATTARASQLSKMAASKQYRLLCLENPLLGKQTWAVARELQAPLPLPAHRRQPSGMASGRQALSC